MSFNPETAKKEILEEINTLYPTFYAKHDQQFWETFFQQAFIYVPVEKYWMNVDVYKLALLYKTLEFVKRSDAFIESNGEFVAGMLPLKEVTYTDNGISIKQVGDSHSMKNNVWLGKKPITSFADAYQDLLDNFTIPNTILFNT